MVPSQFNGSLGCINPGLTRLIMVIMLHAYSLLYMAMDQYLYIPFLVGWTSINPSYFDVNYRGTRFWHTAIWQDPWNTNCHNINHNDHRKRLVDVSGASQMASAVKIWCQFSRFIIHIYIMIIMTIINMAVCQNLVPLVNIKIAGKWMFIPLKMVLIGIDPYPYDNIPSGNLT